MKKSKSAYTSSEKLKIMCTVAMFCALSYVCVLVAPIKVSFLTFDAKDAVMCICAMMFGPLSGVLIAFITSFLEFITISDTGIWGLLMNFISSATYVFIASVIYKYRHSVVGAVLGLLFASAVSTGVMMGANLLITPLYMGVSTQDVAALIPKLLLPFNITKYVLNSAIVMLLYKPCITALRSMNMVKEHKKGAGNKVLTTILVSVGALVVIAICVVIYLVFLNGTLDII